MDVLLRCEFLVYTLSRELLGKFHITKGTIVIKADALNIQLERALMQPPFDSTSRALLYAVNKDERSIQDLIAKIVGSVDQRGTSDTEVSLDRNQINRWNSSLQAKGYIGGKQGLKREKLRGRFDVVGYVDGNVRQLIEVKAWSAGDAVDQSRYRRPGCAQPSKKYNHSISQSFEIDALKMLAVDGPLIQRTVATALFTIHCDGLSKDKMKSMNLGFPDLLARQNLDKAGIGDSDAYRQFGVTRLINELSRQFGPSTEFNSLITHRAMFSRSDATYQGVGISLDMVIADLGASAQ